MKTLKELSLEIDILLRENPQFGDLPIIYSSDDEGNRYQKIHQDITPAQVHNIEEWELELVGFFEEGSEEIDKKDVNCICVN